MTIVRCNTMQSLNHSKEMHHSDILSLENIETLNLFIRFCHVILSDGMRSKG